jgi:ABC-type Co2+ transport system permease subunit
MVSQYVADYKLALANQKIAQMGIFKPATAPQKHNIPSTPIRPVATRVVTQMSNPAPVPTQQHPTTTPVARKETTPPQENP